MDYKPIAIENGSSNIKIGYAGNLEPDIVIPTAIACLKSNHLHIPNKIKDDYNYFIGEKAIEVAKNPLSYYKLSYPIKNKFIQDWDLMEKFFIQCIDGCLRAKPEEHFFALTEPHDNIPKKREKIGEIFFEIYNVKGLFIGTEPFFGFLGINKIFKDEDNIKNLDQEKAIKTSTGIIVDSGEGLTNIIPITEGIILESRIKQFPIGGNSITTFVKEMIKERDEKINPEDLSFASKGNKRKGVLYSR